MGSRAKRYHTCNGRPSKTLKAVRWVAFNGVQECFNRSAKSAPQNTLKHVLPFSSELCPRGFVIRYKYDTSVQGYHDTMRMSSGVHTYCTNDSEHGTVCITTMAGRRHRFVGQPRGDGRGRQPMFTNDQPIARACACGDTLS